MIMRWLVAVLGVCSLLVAPAVATTLTATITADDDFRIYVSTDDNTLGTLLGEGSTADGSWASSSTFTYDLAPGVTYYVHVVAWDLYKLKAALLADLSLSDRVFQFRNGTQNLLTDSDTWYISDSGFGAGYYAPDALGQNLPTTKPWYVSVPGISSDAQWIWSNAGLDFTTRYFSTMIASKPNMLDVTTTDGGTVTDPGLGTFVYEDAGIVIPAVALPNTGYHFTGWTGSAVTLGKVADPASASTTVTSGGNLSLQANFAIDQETLIVSSTDGGAVSTPGEGTFTYGYGTVVPVVAAPEPYFHFVGWTGTAVTLGEVADPGLASTSVTLRADGTLQANFAPDTYTLTVNATHGSVTRIPDKPSYVHGETVLLQATPDLNYDFKGWSGDASGADDPIVVTMDGNKSITAAFALCMRILNLSSTAGGNVTAPGEGTFEYAHGDQVMLEATADPGFVFVHWRGSLSSDRAPYLLTMDGDYTIKAIFQSTSDILYVDDDAPADPGPCDMNVSDPREAGTCDHPFDSIQEAIDVAKEGARIVIRPGTYWEIIDLLGKGLTLDGLMRDGLSCGDAGCGPLPVINGLGRGTVVTCNEDECSEVKNPHVFFRGLVITGGWGRVAGGIVGRDSSPSFENCLIVGNRAADPNVSGYIGSVNQGCVNGGACYFQDCNVVFANCTLSGNYGVVDGPVMGFKNCGVTMVDGIVWDNGPIVMVADGPEQPVVTYTDFTGGILGLGNVNVNPLFAMPGFWADPMDLTRTLEGTDPEAVWVAGDYHLQSQAGRWSPVQGWVKDQATSPCIDAGNPTASAGQEPLPNGGRLNLGAYGGTCQASMSVK
jgi:uncharacterized repeat protein (TIGR02543 family)